MKKIFLGISIALILAFWPMSFLLANKQSFIIYTLALAILLIGWILYLKKIKYYYFVYLVLPLIHPAYLVFPFVAIIFIVRNSKKSLLAIYSSILIFISIFSYKTFYAYSIFTPDPLAIDTISKKNSLIPNPLLGKLFENKTTVFQVKFKSNFFVSMDINNYFFSLHPQEMGNNQNLNKYPYLAIIPFLIGLFYIMDNRQKKWIISSFLTAAFSLAFINNQDKFDIILYLPITLICIFGLIKLSKISNKFYWLFTLVFISISTIEFVRIILSK